MLKVEYILQYVYCEIKNTFIGYILFKDSYMHISQQNKSSSLDVLSKYYLFLWSFSIYKGFNSFLHDYIKPFIKLVKGDLNKQYIFKVPQNVPVKFVPVNVPTQAPQYQHLPVQYAPNYGYHLQGI